MRAPITHEDLIATRDWVLANPTDPLGPYGTTFLYAPAEWLDAAQQADEDDFADLRFMVERSELREEYQYGTDGDGLPWSDWDFEDFLAVVTR